MTGLPPANQYWESVQYFVFAAGPTKPSCCG
jgi:hypothetical protein